MNAEETLRVFIAITMPPEVRALMQQIQAQLGRYRLPVRWVDPSEVHLTLKFLGQVATATVDQIAERMNEVAAASRPLTLRTGTLGCFPNMSRPRVVWLGLGGALQELGLLQARIEQALVPLGFAIEQRPFTPHLTLGRTFKDTGREHLQAIGRAVTQTDVSSSETIEVREMVLMRSHLQPSGARYTTLARARLRGDDQRERPSTNADR